MPELWARVPDLNGLGYGEFLDGAWARHLAPRECDAPTLISTFAGCGGSSLGYSMAGYRELLANEWDALACATFRRNLPGIDMVEGDVHDLAAEEALGRAALRKGELDLLDGSPPCQGFSVSGKRREGDPRNRLFEEFIRLLRGLMPRTFVMENVAGLAKGRMRPVFIEILRELRSSGYVVRAWEIDARRHNVPQTRSRIIFLGAREDLGLEPTPPPVRSGDIAVEDALAGVESTEDDMQWARRMGANRHAQKWLPCMRPGENKHRYSGGPGFSLYRLHPRRPSNCILSMVIPCGMPVRWDEDRCLTTEEAKRVCSFPDAFVVEGDHPTRRWAQLGNCVPPLFMESIASHIRGTLLAKGG